jgi:hypothetical protein
VETKRVKSIITSRFVHANPLLKSTTHSKPSRLPNIKVDKTIFLPFPKKSVKIIKFWLFRNHFFQNIIVLLAVKPRILECCRNILTSKNGGAGMEKIFKSSRMRPSWEMCASNTYLNITIIRHEYHFTCVSLQGDYLHSMRSNHCQSADYNQNKSSNSPFSALDLIPDIESKINVLINQFKEFQTGFNRKHESSREKWMGASEAMQYMNVPKNTFDRYRYELTPKLPGYPVKGKVFYSKDDIDEWIRSYMYRSQVLS